MWASCETNKRRREDMGWWREREREEWRDREGKKKKKWKPCFLQCCGGKLLLNLSKEARSMLIEKLVRPIFFTATIIKSNFYQDINWYRVTLSTAHNLLLGCCSNGITFKPDWNWSHTHKTHASHAHTQVQNIQRISFNLSGATITNNRLGSGRLRDLPWTVQLGWRQSNYECNVKRSEMRKQLENRISTVLLQVPLGIFGQQRDTVETPCLGTTALWISLLACSNNHHFEKLMEPPTQWSITNAHFLSPAITWSSSLHETGIEWSMLSPYTPLCSVCKKDTSSRLCVICTNTCLYILW